MNYRLYFLIHFARSGSTLLANELDKNNSIGVTIEENLADGIKKGKPVNLKNTRDLDDYLELLYKDEKFHFWNIEKNELRNHLLEACSFPLQFRDILQTIHSLYFEASRPEIVIHKQGNYSFFIGKVKTEFPKAGFLFIDRDPRAIYNSQKRSRKSTSSKSMNQGIVRFALSYKRMHQMIRRYISEDYFYSFKYENFIKNKISELQQLSDFLGIKPAENHKTESYSSRIPGPQKYLHQNVGGNYDLSRTEGWKKELENHRIVFLQTALKQELLEKDYGLNSTNSLRPFQKVKVMYWCIIFRIAYFLLKSTNWHYFSFRKGTFRKFGYG